MVELPAEELIGINTRTDLARAEALMQARLRRGAMEAGATLVAPETVFLSADTRLGRDAVIEPNVVFGPGVEIGEGARIRSFSHIEGAVVGVGAIVGPFARLRPGAVLEAEVHVGNFVEIKASRLGIGAKASHLSYIGDSEIGARSNIGAGTITCNYDGVNKHRTIIGEDAFIGSNTALVAPVTVGRRGHRRRRQRRHPRRGTRRAERGARAAGRQAGSRGRNPRPAAEGKSDVRHNRHHRQGHGRAGADRGAAPARIPRL